ncbi:protein VAPYRIN-like [Nicotiana sylvestris]|uniref:Ankyrin-1-like n=1 Tax=Nicotiana sylvestris TaxID=4096 RepID=A0A1U7XY85_NICSY|nr:PREDICTED: ankyrin-1-like [Nicotiana sylvestris]
MDRLISLESSNMVTIRIEPGQKCSGELTLRNVMYTMPVAFRLQPLNKTRYTVRPQSGIISPITAVKLEIIYLLPPNTNLPESIPRCDDSFLLHSVVAPGAAVKGSSSTLDSVPIDWFTTKKKHVFIDSAIKVMFVGSSVLCYLVRKGYMEEIREVLERSDPKWKPADSVDHEGQTLLHLAIAQGRPDLVQLLLEFQSNIEAHSRSGSSPLEAASASGDALIVELLLANRASSERTELSAWGPIHLAAGNGHLEVLKLLIVKGANLNSLTKDGNTALHLAVQERRRDCARLLLVNGARADIQNAGDGDTPLHIAAASGDEHIVRLLLHKGAEKNIRNKYGKTAYDVTAEHGYNRLFDALRLGDSLCVAARKGDVRTIQRLIENGASINGRDQHGWTALHRASFKGKIDVVRSLIDMGIEMDGKDGEGYTALHCAVESGHVDVAEMLVKKGADVEARTSKGVTALQIAESLHYSGLTRILIQGGAEREGTKVESLAAHKPLRKVAAREMDIRKIKKKASNNARVSRSSFDRTVTLSVV